MLFWLWYEHVVLSTDQQVKYSYYMLFSLVRSESKLILMDL